MFLSTAFIVGLVLGYLIMPLSKFLRKLYLVYKIKKLLKDLE